MKQFIVLLACLPILLIFMVQFSMDEINHQRIGLLTDIVEAAKEEARQQGCFTEEIRRELRGAVSERLGVPAQQVRIEATSSPVYRLAADDSRGLIHYKVTVPVGSLMAGHRLFGIRDDANVYYYVIESYAASELLP